MQPDLDIRRFDPSPTAYAEMAALWNALNPEWPRDPTTWMRFDLARPPVRVLAWRGTTLVGGAEVCATSNVEARGVHDLTLFARPDVAGASALEPLYLAIRALLPERARVVQAYIPDDRPWLMQSLDRHGFRSTQQTAYSQYRASQDLPDGAWLRRALGHGYEVTSCRALEMGQSPVWRRRYWELHVKVLAEVPFAIPLKPPEFEEFNKDLDNPDKYNLDASFVGMHQGSFVGLSRLTTPTAIPNWAFTDLTGTLPAHRRKGLAAMLKILTMGYARESGIETVVSLNDVDNPMLALNHRLGFKTLHIQHTMQLDLA